MAVGVPGWRAGVRRVEKKSASVSRWQQQDCTGEHQVGALFCCPGIGGVVKWVRRGGQAAASKSDMNMFHILYRTGNYYEGFFGSLSAALAECDTRNADDEGGTTMVLSSFSIEDEMTAEIYRLADGR